MKSVRKYFPFFKNNPGYIYLDTAATALKLNKQIKAETDFLKKNGTNVFRGAYLHGFTATELYLESKKTVAEFLNCSDKEIIYTKGSTNGLNLIANSIANFIQKGDEFLTSTLEHNANFLPFFEQSKKIGFKIKYIKLNENNQITVENFKKALTKKTKVVSLTYISNVFGYITPIKEIAKICQEKGILLIVDAAQAAARIKIDIQALNCNFLVFSAHKTYGPNGLGVLAGKLNSLKKLNAFEFGGQMVESIDGKEIIYNPAPANLEAGTPAISQAISFTESLKFLMEIGMQNVEKHEKELADLAYTELSKISKVELYTKVPESGIISFNIKGVHPHDALTFYDQEKICLRAGQHCSGLAFTNLDVESALRVSFGIYNNKKDVHRFISTTKKLIEFFQGV